MKRNLGEMIRYISSKNGDVFTSSLKEELNDRLFRSMANTYIQVSENLYSFENEAEEIQEGMQIKGVASSNFSINASQKHEPSSNVPAKKRIFQKPVQSGQMREDASTNELISSLQESIRDEKQ